MDGHNNRKGFDMNNATLSIELIVLSIPALLALWAYITSDGDDINTQLANATWEGGLPTADKVEW
jgi:hypothetical protein